MKSERTICILIFPQTHLMDLAGPVQAFYEASYLGNIDYRLIFASDKREALSAQGLWFGNLTKFENITLRENDFLIIPGIDFKSFRDGCLEKETETMGPWIQRQYEHRVCVASICSGALILADIGLLNGKKCTSHWKCIEYLKEHYPDAVTQTDKLYTRDKGIYTSAGMASGIDMVLSIIEQEQGPLVSAKVAREMVVYMRRRGNDEQQHIYLDFRTHFNPSIHYVQDYIISNPEKNPTLTQLASLVNMSERNLTRSFKEATGHTISEFKNEIKAELARNLIDNPRYTLNQIAGMCGFASTRHLRRIWKRKFGNSIRDYKKENV